MADDQDKRSKDNLPTDPMALVQYALRESYLQTTEDLRYYAEKVRWFNKQKKAVREYLLALRDVQADDRSTDGARGFKVRARKHPVDEFARQLRTPDRVPPSGITTSEAFENEIARWEEKLNSIGDDAQLANVDLQNILQKQQQTLQMMSNISKMLYDTASSVIRKMGG